MNDTKDTNADSRVFSEFSPKIWILQARKGLFYLRSKWIAILVVATIIGIVPAIYYHFQKPTYIAEVTFALDETVTQQAANFSSDFGIAGEMGLDAFDAGTIFASMTNIIELMQSRLLIEKTLRKSVIVGTDTLFFADFFLDSLGYRKKWLKKGPRLDFSSARETNTHTLLENNIIRNIHSTLIARNLKVSTKGRGTTIILASCVSFNESFSKLFLEALLDEVTHYYIETKTQRSKNNIATLQRRTDSVRLAYNKALYGRASFTDVHINPSRQIVNVSLQKQQTDIQILSTSYVELVRSLELAKTALVRETPLIQYVDMPISPLPVIKPNSVQKFIMFFILGIFLCTMYFVIVKLYRYILNS